MNAVAHVLYGNILGQREDMNEGSQPISTKTLYPSQSDIQPPNQTLKFQSLLRKPHPYEAAIPSQSWRRFSSSRLPAPFFSLSMLFSFFAGDVDVYPSKLWHR
jgi:hypothetical protein